MNDSSIRTNMENTFHRKSAEYIFDYELCDFVKEHICGNKIPKLYRYSPADYNNIRSLEKGQIYLSEAGLMNDIFEGLSCEIDERVIENLNMLNDIAYLKSFTENKNDLLMWANYADNYAGMCVQYDLECIEAENPLLYHLFPVVYTDKRYTKANLAFSYEELKQLKQDIDEKNCPDSLEFLKDIMGLFVTKSECWKNEKEWRLIVSYLQMNLKYDEVDADGDDETEILYAINDRTVSFPYAKTIYLGPRMRASVKEHLKEIGQKIGANVLEMTLSKDTYELIEKRAY